MLKRGEYKISVKKDGYKTEIVKVNLIKNRELSVNLTKKRIELNIYVEPYGADIIISGDEEYEYYDGINLPAGEYEIVVSMYGYETQHKFIEINRALDLTFSLKRVQKQEKKFKLKIITDPANAEITVMSNKVHDYYDNMMLKKGEYEIVVSKDGYETKQKFIFIDANKKLRFLLQKIESEREEEIEEEKPKRKMFFGF